MEPTTLVTIASLLISLTTGSGASNPPTGYPTTETPSRAPQSAPALSPAPTPPKPANPCGEGQTDAYTLSQKTGREYHCFCAAVTGLRGEVTGYNVSCY